MVQLFRLIKMSGLRIQEKHLFMFYIPPLRKTKLFFIKGRVSRGKEASTVLQNKKEYLKLLQMT